MTTQGVPPLRCVCCGEYKPRGAFDDAKVKGRKKVKCRACHARARRRARAAAKKSRGKHRLVRCCICGGSLPACDAVRVEDNDTAHEECKRATDPPEDAPSRFPVQAVVGPGGETPRLDGNYIYI